MSSFDILFDIPPGEGASLTQQALFFFYIFTDHAITYLFSVCKCLYKVQKEGNVLCSTQTAMIQSSNTLLCHYVCCVCVCIYPIPPATALPRPQSLSLCCLIHSHCSVHTHTKHACLFSYTCLTHKHTYCTYTGTLLFPPHFLFSHTYTQSVIRTPSHAQCKHYWREDWQHSILQQLTVSCR